MHILAVLAELVTLVVGPENTSSENNWGPNVQYDHPHVWHTFSQHQLLQNSIPCKSPTHNSSPFALKSQQITPNPPQAEGDVPWERPDNDVLIYRSVVSGISETLKYVLCSVAFLSLVDMVKAKIAAMALTRQAAMLL